MGLLTFTGWQLAIGGLLITPVALISEPLPTHLTWTNIAGFAYLSLIGAFLAYAVWFRGIERLPALTVSLLGFASPLTATLLGYVFLNQQLTLLQGAGAVAVVAAVLLAQKLPGRVGRQNHRHDGDSVPGTDSGLSTPITVPSKAPQCRTQEGIR